VEPFQFDAQGGDQRLVEVTLVDRGEVSNKIGEGRLRKAYQLIAMNRAVVLQPFLPTSVSALVREFLLRLGEDESDYERRRRLQTEVLASLKDFRAGNRVTREEAHERNARR